MDNIGEYWPFQILLEATNCAKVITRGDFSLGEEDWTDGDPALIRSFNCYWDTQIYPLETQIRYLLINIFQAHQYQPDQLEIGPGLAVCGSKKEAKEKLDLTEDSIVVAIGSEGVTDNQTFERVTGLKINW